MIIEFVLLLNRSMKIMKKSAQISFVLSLIVLPVLFLVSSVEAVGVAGDLNRDGYVDLYDYTLQVASHGSTDCDLSGDFDDDCDVDAADTTYMSLYVGNGNPDATPNSEPIVCPFSEDESRYIVRLSEADSRENATIIRSDKTEARSLFGPVSTQIPAGEYSVTLVTYDDHSIKPNQDQPNEEWYLRFLQNDNIVGRTSIISDLPEINPQTGDPQDWLIEVVDEVFTVPTADSVLAVHDDYKSDNPNSLVPVCAVFEKIAPACAVPPTTLTFDDVDLPEGRRIDQAPGYDDFGVTFRLLPTADGSACSTNFPLLTVPGLPVKGFVNGNTYDDVCDDPSGACSTGKAITDSGYSFGKDVQVDQCGMELAYKEGYRSNYVTFDLLDVDHRTVNRTPRQIESFTVTAYDANNSIVATQTVNGVTNRGTNKIELVSNGDDIARVVIQGEVGN